VLDFQDEAPFFLSRKHSGETKLAEACLPAGRYWESMTCKETIYLFLNNFKSKDKPLERSRGIKYFDNFNKKTCIPII